MKLGRLLTRQEQRLPGVVGTARVARNSGGLPRGIRAGEIVVLDQPDLDQRTAEALAAAEVAGVVNASPSTSGRFPNLGPEVVVSAGIALVDSVGPQILSQLRDGTKLRLDAGTVYVGDRAIAHGRAHSIESVADQLAEAKMGMAAQLEAFSANTIEFLRKERMLILDGVGVPDLTVPLRGRHVVVVAPGSTHADDLERLRRYVKEHHPVLIGVGAAADTLRAAGLRPAVIVGDPGDIATETLTSDAEVVVPAHIDGYAPGLERIQDLGIGAVTFPAACNPEDLALLLAHAHGAALIIAVGFHANLYEFLDRGRAGSNPSTFLTRLRLGGKLVDGTAAAELHESVRTPVAAVVALVLAVLAVLFAALTVSGVGSAVLQLAAHDGTSVLAYFRGFFT